MGCCGSRKVNGEKFEDDFFLPFEYSLNIKKFNIGELVTKFGRFSNTPHLTFSQVSQIFESLHLPFQEFIDFFDQFDRNRSSILTEKKFSYFQLQSLNILLSKSDPKSKIHFLFTVYKITSVTIISQLQVQIMLENLLKVALDYIPNYFLVKNPENLGLLEYKTILKKGSDILIDKFTTKLMRYKKGVLVHELMNNLFKYVGGRIFCTRYLREQAYQLGTFGRKVKMRKGKNENVLSEANFLLVDDFSDVSLELLSVTNSKSRHKKSISNLLPSFGYYLSEDGMDSDRHFVLSDCLTVEGEYTRYKTVNHKSHNLEGLIKEEEEEESKAIGVLRNEFVSNINVSRHTNFFNTYND